MQIAIKNSLLVGEGKKDRIKLGVRERLKYTGQNIPTFSDSGNSTYNSKYNLGRQNFVSKKKKKVQNVECFKNGRKKRGNNPYLGTRLIRRYSKNWVRQKMAK